MARYQARSVPTTVLNAAITLSVLAVVAAPAVSASAESGGDQPEFSWELLDSGTDAFLNSLDAVSPDVAWAASLDGVVLRTVDGGATFTDVSPPDSAEVDFLDVDASSADDALLVSVGPAGAGIYRTADGGESWDVPFVSPETFLTSMAMFDRRHGFVVSDPIDGKFQIMVTNDAGRSWELTDPAAMPDALDGEFSFAFTGNAAAATGSKAFFGTAFARVFRSTDRGQTWEVSSTADECCIAGLDFRTNRLGLAVGENVSRTTDGGATWTLVDEDDAPVGFSGDVAWWSDLRGDERSAITDAQRTVFANADDGSVVSRDRGKTWEQFSDQLFYGIECAEDSEACWGAGELGAVARLVVS